MIARLLPSPSVDTRLARRVPGDAARDHAYARGAFAHLNPEARQDMIQEVIANALVAYVRLYQQGRVALAYPTVLARYGVAQVRDGRRVGAKLNIKDLLSRYCQKRKGVVVERLEVSTKRKTPGRKPSW